MGDESALSDLYENAQQYSHQKAQEGREALMNMTNEGEPLVVASLEYCYREKDSNR